MISGAVDVVRQPLGPLRALPVGRQIGWIASAARVHRRRCPPVPDRRFAPISATMTSIVEPPTMITPSWPPARNAAMPLAS